MANITGWGRGTWGQLTWGEPIPVELTGLAGTSAISSLTITAAANVAVTGLAGTGAISSVVATGAANVTETGVAGVISRLGIQYRWSSYRPT